MSGIGSLITFQGLTQGVLTTAARTIQSALDIEKANVLDRFENDVLQGNTENVLRAVKQTDDKNGTWQWAKLNHPDWLLEDNRVKVRICDGYSDATLSEYEDDSFDYIIDDGPHTVESQLVAIDKWLAKVKPGGKLIIEDIQSQSDLNRLIDAAVSTGYDHKVFDMVNNKGRYDDIIIEITKK